MLRNTTLSLAMAFSVLTACGDDDNKTQDTRGGTDTIARDTVATDTVATDTAQATVTVAGPFDPQEIVNLGPFAFEASFTADTPTIELPVDDICPATSTTARAAFAYVLTNNGDPVSLYVSAVADPNTSGTMLEDTFLAVYSGTTLPTNTSNCIFANDDEFGVGKSAAINYTIETGQSAIFLLSTGQPGLTGDVQLSMGLDEE